MLAAVFIDGGYLTSILRQLAGPRIDYQKFVAWACQGESLFRAYYYDCLPYQSPQPTPVERQRVSDRQRFFAALQRGHRFTIREGRLEYRGRDSNGNQIFQQKRVDLLLGLDIATLVTRDKVQMIVLVSGDSDLIPAVDLAQREGVLARLVHGPARTYHAELGDAVDERLELTAQDVSALRL